MLRDLSARLSRARRPAFGRASATKATTLLEVVVGTTLTVLVLVSALESVESAGRVSSLQTQRRTAIEAAAAKLGYLRSLRFANVLSTVAACSTLSSFSVPGLPMRRTPGASQGSLTVYTNETAIPSEAGGPFDLNGNGTATDTNVTGTALILPVCVTVTWGTVGPGNPEAHVTLWTILDSADAP